MGVRILTDNMQGAVLNTSPIVEVKEQGITLRDYFAGQALVGIIASYTGDMPLPTTKIAAITAYDFADALIVERANQREGEK